MSGIVATNKVKIKNSQPIDLDKKNSIFRTLTILDPLTKRGKSIQIDKETFKDVDKSLSDAATKNISFSAESYIPGTDRGSSKENYTKRLPFEFVKSTAGVDYSSTKAGMTITNNLLDDEAMQGPWVREYVGGYFHRRNKFNSSTERTEAYTIVENSEGLLISQPVVGPRNYRRDSAGSPCYNVGNRPGGNYSSIYEVVLSSGRYSNNSYLVASSSLLLSQRPSSSAYISGLFDFPNPERGKSSHIIVNKFSSPGGPETAGSFGRDRESDEYSIYSTVNYRNRVIRETLDAWSSTPTKKFGIRSGSVDAAAFHKVHRNTTRFINDLGNRTRDDNLFVNRSIPSNDYGYLWISRSAEDGVYDFLNKNSNLGHQNLGANYSNLESSRTINFLSKSLADGIGTGPDSDRLTYSGLNFVTNNEITESENLLQYTSGNLNQQLTNANGPYGWPTWRQLRSYENPIVRKQRSSNNISVTFRGTKANAFCFPGTEYDYGNTVEQTQNITTERKVESFVEPAVSSRFYPLQASLHFFENVAPEGIVISNKVPDLIPQQTLKNLWESRLPFHSMLRQGTADNIVTDSTTVSMLTSVQSNISKFANQSLSIKLNSKEMDFFHHENLQKINNFFITSREDNRSNVVRQLSYVETLYPKEKNSYINLTLSRPSFDFFGWKKSRNDRELILGGNLNYGSPLTNTEKQRIFITSSVIDKEVDFVKSYYNSYDKIDLNATGSDASVLSGSTIVSSKWVLDSRKDFAATPVNITASYFDSPSTFLENRDQGKRGEGILQNDYSIFPLGYNGLRGAPPYAPVYNRRIPQVFGDEVYLAGESQWQATGSTDLGPFYENYSAYAKDMKYLSRGHSLVPEFTMSSLIESIYTSSDFEKAATPESFLQLTGTSQSTNSDLDSNVEFFKNFSNSEFMKFFKPLVEDMQEIDSGLKPGRLTLRCQASLKMLPYRGFYPAERAVQISEIFHRNYLHKNSYLANYIPNIAMSQSQSNQYLDLRIENAKSQVIKPLFAPGVLFNSIKSGLAVDYPIDSALTYILANNATSSIDKHDIPRLGLTSTACFTGSILNGTEDEGVPRIKGNVSRRITMEDLISPERLIDEVIYDNEPHPSASYLYGSAEWLRVLNRPAIFGNLNRTEVKEKNAIDFNITKESFANSMRPYKSAINNFTAETVGFFLKDGKLQTHVSDAVNPYLKSGVTYKMRVYVNNQDVVMYDRHSAFGPPVNDDDIPRTSFVTSSTFAGGSFASSTVTFTGITRTSIDDSTIRLTDYNNTIRDYRFVNGYSTNPAAATGTVLFNLTGTSLNGSEITLRAAGSTQSKTYLFTTLTKAGSTGSVYFGKVVVSITSSMSPANCAAQFQAAVTSSNGHQGLITTSYDSSSGVVTLTQNSSGTTGNITIVGTGKFHSSGGRISGFSGGTNGVIHSTGQNHDSAVVVQVQSDTTPGALASSLKSAMDSSNGHKGSISTTVSGDLLKMAQTTIGTLGNRVVTGTGVMVGSVTQNFSGGSEPTGISFLTQETVIQSASHGFLPYIPPFLDPGTRPYAEISFTPSESSNYTIPTIIENCSITYHNLDAPTTDAENTTNYVNAMSVSASIDLKKYVSLYSDNFTLEEDGTRTAKKESKKYRWVIQPKWETPIMDFSDSKVAALDLSTNEVNFVTGSPWKQRDISNYYEILNKTNISYLTASTGMWHQSGTVLNDGDLKGYYLSIESGEEDINSNKGDLASELGFIDKSLKSDKNYSARPLNSKRLGTLAKEKTISESVIAIPYYLLESDKIKLFDLNKTELAKARGYNSKIKDSFSYNLQRAKAKSELEEIENDYLDWFDSVGHDSVSSISYQLRMMEKYVLPPHFDFIKNEKVNPHVMYFFQFKSKLEESDLARIWQNLYPRSPTGPGCLKKGKIQKLQRETDVQYITGFLDTTILPEELGVVSNYENYELFLENNVRWLVFKVKLRSKNQLSEAKNFSIPRFSDDLELVNGIQTQQPLSVSVTENEDSILFSKYSYNWPYDYFSLVESIKMESKVDFYSPVLGASTPSDVEQPLTTRASTQVESGVESGEESVTQIIVASDTTAASEDPLGNLVIRQEVKSDLQSAPSPANVFTVSVSSGYQIKLNSESIYVNGVLQVAGSSMDYTISGSTITFNYDIQDGDSIYITYIKE